MIQAVHPRVNSESKWKVDKELEAAERDLVCEAVRAMVQPRLISGVSHAR